MKNILVPLSLWETADLVVEQSARLAQALESSIHLLHVVHISGMAAQANWPEELRKEKEREVGKLRKKLEALRSRLEEQGLDARIIVEETDDVALAILEQADKLNVDMIVMGTQDRGLLYKALLGDVTTEVLRQASCPVLLVPMKMFEGIRHHEKK